MSEAMDGAAVPSHEAESRAPVVPGWGRSRRIGFRFLFSYFVLYVFPFPLGVLPWTEKAGELYGKLLDPMVHWVGANILGIDYPIATELNGSGDRTYDYVLLFCQLVLAIAATAIWSLVDRRSRRYERLLEGLRLYVRVYLGTMMLAYGFAKIFQGQFQPPGPQQLATTFGDSSPMGLLWTFMGFSRPYTMFAGFMEALPGALLFFRRTATVGALVLLAVMGNVVLLNFCYDVPVKLFSVHLWLMCLFLAAPAIPRLIAVLVLNRAAPPLPSPPLFTSRRTRTVCAALYVIASGALAYDVIVPRVKRHIEMTRVRPASSAMRDHYTVDEITVNGQTLALADADRWSGVWIQREAIRINWADGRSVKYLATAEIKGSTALDLRLPTDAADVRRAHLEMRREAGKLILDGHFEGKRVTARLASIGVTDSLLMTRGFHWINEAPFSR